MKEVMNMEDRYLFKAKHFEKWHIGNIVKESDGLYIRDKKKNVMAYIDDESTICQCTGLKDKDGKLIWENDIIKRLDIHDIKEPSIGIIEYDVENTSFLIHWTDIANYSPTFHWKNRIGVIGNIFDNPELLESEE